MSIRIPLSTTHFITIFSVYAPTLDADDNIKEEFYRLLDRELTNVPQNDKLLLLGDFNARVGKDHNVWRKVIGKEGLGSCNPNGHLLLGLCAEHHLVVTNTIFRQRNRFKTTWMHPRSKNWHILDYVITRQRDLQDILITRSMPSADDCWTDHRLVISKLRISLKTKTRYHSNDAGRRKFDITKLKDTATASSFQETINRKIRENPITANSLEEEWATLKDIVTESAKETIGFQKKKHQDWFDSNSAEITKLLDNKKAARLAYENDSSSRMKLTRFKEAKSECQRGIREIQNTWWQEKAQELQRYADERDLRKFYAGTKELYGPQRSSVCQIKDADNTTVITEKDKILERWKEHFQTLLNRPSSAAANVLEKVPQLPLRPAMTIPPSFTEFTNAYQRMNLGKAPGPDNIPFELLKSGGHAIKTRLFILIQRMWERGEIPRDMKDALIVTIFKKGDRNLCGNYRGISLLSIAGKIFARILLNRLQDLAESIFPESQCGFRQSRGTIDMIFCARQLQEKSREQRKPLYFIFYDLEKAFDSVPRTIMWDILRRFGCPDHFVTMVQAFHDGMKARVLYDNNISKEFDVTMGLKQGCVLAPTLFSLYLAAMFYELPEDNPGVRVRHRYDGGLFNLSRFHSHRLCEEQTITELQYADDNAALCSTEHDLQTSTNNFLQAYETFGLKVNFSKTKVLAQPAPGTAIPQPHINLNGENVEVVDSFCYLGSFLTSNGTAEKDVEHRIQAAHCAFGKLKPRVFTNKDLTYKTKIMVYQAVVLSTLLYGCETWTLYRKDIRKLERFHQSKLRTILNIKWEDRITNNAVLEKAHLKSVEATMTLHRLRWTGHVCRMEGNRLPKMCLYSELTHGRRRRGAPLRRYKDQLKTTLKQSNIDLAGWETATQDRKHWREVIKSGAEHLESTRINHDEENRERRKARALMPKPPPTINCEHCPKLFHAQIGYRSHLRYKHRNIQLPQP